MTVRERCQVPVHLASYQDVDVLGCFGDELGRLIQEVHLQSVLPILPKQRLGPPENYLFLLLTKCIYGIKVSIKTLNLNLKKIHCLQLLA